MTTPLTYKTYNYSSRVYSVDKTWYRQKKPYDLRLACRLWYAYALNESGDSRSWARDEYSAPNGTVVQNKARERLVSELGDTAQIGAAIAVEWRGAAEMIASRSLQLFRFTNALRKGQFKKASVILGVKTPRGAIRKYKARNLGGAWLEYSYGWAPLVSDIYAASQIIETRPSDQTVRGKAGGSVTQVIVGSPPPYEYRTTVKWVYLCQMIADIKVTNPNLYLSNQLGLTNPGSWLLEGIPFSFIVDWFSNLSQWVSQTTDFLGCDVTKPATTILVKCEEHDELFYPGQYVSASWKRFAVMRRTSSIPPVKLHFEYEVPNWKRGLNAVSLLTQALRSI